MPNILLRPWRRAIDFRGRATRTEYWLFVVQLIVVFFLWSFLVGAVSALFDSPVLAGLLGMVSMLYLLFVFVASLAAAVRRLHDHDKTGWLYLITLVPLVGWIFYLIMMLTPGTRGENSYGYDPREGDRPTADEMVQVFS
ncbi:DUF805 domain-containing protein [Sphingosinicella sp. BN140058]|uniref:DUF805 domain-containing protein n=1 Tax=Sphingosinicella sp. BN140058 TaxID=1892855 RepID=UPI001012111B|nr:DUF805 domain-containing protein [Sphingosinicella sp. BN140058]QAY78334.1 DUF805 domain-containing protein [Sphingosinicella sp. BN140058]